MDNRIDRGQQTRLRVAANWASMCTEFGRRPMPLIIGAAGLILLLFMRRRARPA